MILSRFLIVLVAAMLISSTAYSQPSSISFKETLKSKPFKVLTAGREITIKSTKNINSIMVWTTGGHRVVEQKKLNTTTVQFRVPVSGNQFFLMIQMTDGTHYSQKIGLP